MTIELIMALLVKYGPAAEGFIEFLIKKIEAKGTVSLQEWTDQQAALRVTASDLMLAQLKAAGIDPASPEGIAMLALTNPK